MSIDLMPGFGAFTQSTTALLDGSESDGTNLLGGTDALSSWTESGGTVSRSAVLAPNGATEGLIFAGDGFAGRKLLYEQLASLAADTYTLSMYAKQNTLRYIQIIPAGSGSGKAWIYADLQDGLITDTGDLGGNVLYVSSSIAAAVNGYYKVSITFSDSGTASPSYLQLSLSDRATHGGSLSFDSPDFTTTASVYLWRPRLVAP